METSLVQMLEDIKGFNDISFIANKSFVKSFLDSTTSMYEDENNSPISDSDWDAVQIRYSKLVEPYQFGSEVNVGGLVDTEHFMNDISGIDTKITSLDELKDYLKGIDTTRIVKIRHSEKFDGMSIMLELDTKTYRIKRALTRGKSGKGVNFTNVFKGKSLDEDVVELLREITVDDLYKICLRAEVIMTQESFEKYILDTGIQYKDRRSCVAGLMKKALFGNLNSDIMRYVVLKPFLLEINDVSNIQLTYKTLFKGYVMGKEKIFEHTPVDYSELIFSMQENESRKRQYLKYEIDGTIFYLFDEEENVIDRFAYKFAPYSVDTKLLDIEYDFSPKSGILTPMGCIDITYNGREFKRVSLANVGRVRREKFTVGSTVNFTYRGDVMGYLEIVEQNTNGESKIPENCPFCEEKLELKVNEAGEETFLVCNNTTCDGKKAGLILNHLQKLDIKGIDVNTVQQLVEELNITNLTELYRLSVDQLLELDGFKDKKANNIIDAIHSKVEIFDYEILGSLNIKNVGLTTAELVLKQISIVDLVVSLERDRLATIEFLIGIKGIERTIATYLVDGINKNLDDLTYLLLCVYPSYKKVKDSIKQGGLPAGKTFVVTGGVDLFENRNELTKYIKGYGHKVVDSVSSKTDYLVNNDIHSNSSKNKKAKELNIPILTEEDMKNLIEGK